MTESLKLLTPCSMEPLALMPVGRGVRQEYVHRRSASEDFRHHGDLMSFLDRIPLIDADCINPHLSRPVHLY